MKKLVVLLLLTGFASGAEDIRSYYKPTPELVAHGKQIFQSMCIACHGAEGYGDTPTGKAIKARNFHGPRSDWKNGPKVTGIFTTVTQGLPGTPMAAYESLPVKDRFAIAHYIRETFVPKENQLADSDADFRNVEQKFELFNQEVAFKIPLETAMKMIAEEFPEPVAKEVNIPASQEEGARIYAARCASCHGNSGEGYKAKFANLTETPPPNSIRAFRKDSPALASLSAFVKKNGEGQPGVLKPANGDLNSEEWSKLYSFVKFIVAQ